MRRNPSSRSKSPSLKWRIPDVEFIVEFIVEVRCVDSRPGEASVELLRVCIRPGEANVELLRICIRRVEVSIGVRCIGIRAIGANTGARRIGGRAMKAWLPLICAVAAGTAKTHWTTQLRRMNFFEFITL